MRKSFILSLLLVVSMLTKAQEVRIAASWSAAIPFGETSTFVNATSGRGMQFEIDSFINERWTLGGNFGWQSFFQKNYKLYLNEQSIISGVQRNYINSLILMATSKYYFSTESNKIKAYLSLDIGTTVIENWEIFGNQHYKELLWHFALAPGVGMDIPIIKNFGMQIYVKYDNSFKNKNSIHYSWLNTGVGLFLIIPSETK